MEIILGYLFIFGARVIDVSLGTMRMLMVVKGRRLYAAIIGFFEVIIYIVALGKVVSGLNNVGNILAYALGFASGNFFGIYLEEKVALGNLTVQVVMTGDVDAVVDTLRDKGFGVTVLEGHGKKGTRYILNIILKRKDLSIVHSVLDEFDEDAFVTVSDTRHIRGGYFSKIKKK